MTDILQSSADNNLRFLWVDGFLADDPVLGAGATKLTVTAFVAENGSSFVPYRATLSLSRRGADAYRRGEWEGFLPERGSSDWLTFSRADRKLGIGLRLRPRPPGP